jgi:hypothetical protein
MSARRRAQSAWADVEDDKSTEDVGNDEDDDGDAGGSVGDAQSAIGWESTDGSVDDASWEDREEEDVSSAGGDGDEGNEEEEEHEDDDDDDDDDDNDYGSASSMGGVPRRGWQHAESRPAQDVEASDDDAPLLPRALLDAAAHFKAVRAPPRSQPRDRDASESDSLSTTAPSRGDVSLSADAQVDSAADNGSVVDVDAGKRCNVIVFNNNGYHGRCTETCDSRYASSLRGTWELHGVQTGMDPAEVPVCLRHYNADKSKLQVLANPKLQRTFRGVMCRACDRRCCIVSPDDGGGNETGWVQVETDVYVRVPTLALRCKVVTAHLALPPAAVHTRNRAGYLCAACLSALGVHLIAVGGGREGGKDKCDHDEKHYATGAALLKAAQDAAAAARKIGAPLSNEPDGGMQAGTSQPQQLGQAIVGSIKKWWDGKAIDDKRAFQTTADPCAVLSSLPSDLRAFLEGVAVGDEQRAREAARKATERGSDDPKQRAEIEQRRAVLVQGRLAMIASLICSLALPSTHPGILEALCRLHAKGKWRYEEGIVLRKFGVHSRLPASERRRERAREAGPAPSVTAAMAAGGTVAMGTDNFDMARAGPAKGDVYSVAKTTFHGTASVLFIYRSKAKAASVFSSFSKGRARAPVAPAAASASINSETHASAPLPMEGLSLPAPWLTTTSTSSAADASANDVMVGVVPTGAVASNAPGLSPEQSLVPVRPSSTTAPTPSLSSSAPKAVPASIAAAAAAAAAASTPSAHPAAVPPPSSTTALSPTASRPTSDIDAMELDNELESSPVQRACTALPARSSPSLSWFDAGPALIQAERKLVELVPSLRASRLNVNAAMDQVIDMVANLSDRAKDELVADVFILPTSTRAATTNRGVRDALDHGKASLPVDQDSMQVIADQAVYVRVDEVRDTAMREYGWAHAYPGMSRWARTARSIAQFNAHAHGYVGPHGTLKRGHVWRVSPCRHAAPGLDLGPVRGVRLERIWPVPARPRSWQQLSGQARARFKLPCWHACARPALPCSADQRARRRDRGRCDCGGRWQRTRGGAGGAALYAPGTRAPVPTSARRTHWQQRSFF